MKHITTPLIYKGFQVTSCMYCEDNVGHFLKDKVDGDIMIVSPKTYQQLLYNSWIDAFMRVLKGPSER